MQHFSINRLSSLLELSPEHNQVLLGRKCMQEPYPIDRVSVMGLLEAVVNFQTVAPNNRHHSIRLDAST